MRRSILGGIALGGAIACENTTQLEPTMPTSTPAAAVEATRSELRVRNLGTLGGTFSQAVLINERREIVGIADLPSGEIRAFLWRPGEGMRSLGTLGGANSFANGMNDRGEVVGFSEIRAGSELLRGFIWSKEHGMRRLGVLAGDESSGAQAINNRREIVGVSVGSDGLPHAFLQTVGDAMRPLGTLGGGYSIPIDINDKSQVVGGSERTDGREHAFLWTANRGIEDLGTLGGATSTAFGISQSGEVVGVSQNAAGSEEAFLWTRGRGMRSLGTLGGPSLAAGVNTHRRVVGSSFTADDLLLPFLWTPRHGIQPLPTLGGDFGQGIYLNEFGDIVGFTTNSRGALRATLWTPVSGPLLVESPGETDAPGISSAAGAWKNARDRVCAMIRQANIPSRNHRAAGACLAR